MTLFHTMEPGILNTMIPFFFSSNILLQEVIKLEDLFGRHDDNWQHPHKYQFCGYFRHICSEHMIVVLVWITSSSRSVTLVMPSRTIDVCTTSTGLRSSGFDVRLAVVSATSWTLSSLISIFKNMLRGQNETYSHPTNHRQHLQRLYSSIQYLPLTAVHYDDDSHYSLLCFFVQ